MGIFLLTKEMIMSPRNKRLALSSPPLSSALEKYLNEVSIGKKIL